MASALTRNRDQFPVGSAVCETAIRMAEFGVSPSAPEDITMKRCPYGSNRERVSNELRRQRQRPPKIVEVDAAQLLPGARPHRDGVVHGRHHERRADGSVGVGWDPAGLSLSLERDRAARSAAAEPAGPRGGRRGQGPDRAAARGSVGATCW